MTLETTQIYLMSLGFVLVLVFWVCGGVFGGFFLRIDVTIQQVFDLLSMLGKTKQKTTRMLI